MNKKKIETHGDYSPGYVEGDYIIKQNYYESESFEFILLSGNTLNNDSLCRITKKLKQEISLKSSSIKRKEKYFLSRKILSYATGKADKINPDSFSVLLDRKARNLLIGEAGIGKTTFLEFIKNEIVYNSVEFDFLPIFINLSEIGRLNLFELIKLTVLNYLSDLTSNDVSAILHTSHPIFLLDGLNEIEYRYISEFQTDLRHLSDILPNATFLLTTRPPVPSVKIFVDIFELLHIEDAQVKEILSLNFRSDKSNEIWNGLSFRLKELFKNPFYSSLLNQSFLDFENNEISPAYLLNHLSNSKIKEIGKSTKSSAAKLLSKIAFWLFLLRKSAFEESLARNIFKKEDNTRKSIVSCLDNLDDFVSVGLLRKQNYTYSFAHQIFQNYYAALHLLNTYTENEEKDIISILNQTFIRGGFKQFTSYYIFEEVTPLICDLCEDPDEFILFLLDNIPDLSAICIGDSNMVSDKVIQSAVNKFSERFNSHSIFRLGETRSSFAIKPLIECFCSKQERIELCGGRDIPAIHEFSFYALLRLPNDTVDKAMQNLLKHKDNLIRERAKKFLNFRDEVKYDFSHIPHKKSKKDEINFEKITQEIRSGVGYQGGIIIIDILTENGSYEAEELLMSLLEHPHRYIRGHAAKALGYLGSRKAIRHIADIFTWTEIDGRECAGQGFYWIDLLIAIDEIGTSASANIIVDLIHNDYDIFNDCQEVLDLMYGIITRYGDTVTLRKLKKYQFHSEIKPFINNAIDKINFLHAN